MCLLHLNFFCWEGGSKIDALLQKLRNVWDLFFGENYGISYDLALNVSSNHLCHGSTLNLDSTRGTNNGSSIFKPLVWFTFRLTRIIHVCLKKMKSQWPKIDLANFIFINIPETECEGHFARMPFLHQHIRALWMQ